MLDFVSDSCSACSSTISKPVQDLSTSQWTSSFLPHYQCANMLISLQSHACRAEGAQLPHGSEAAEGVYEGDHARSHLSLITHLQLADHSRLQTYSNLVQRCFDDCVNDFTTKSLISREEGCVMRCVDKFLKGSERLGARFQEQNAAMMQSGQLPGR